MSGIQKNCDPMEVVYVVPTAGELARTVLQLYGVTAGTSGLRKRVWRVYVVRQGDRQFYVMLVSNSCECEDFCDCAKELLITCGPDYVVYLGHAYSALYRLGTGSTCCGEICDEGPRSKLLTALIYCHGAINDDITKRQGHECGYCGSAKGPMVTPWVKESERIHETIDADPCCRYRPDAPPGDLRWLWSTASGILDVEWPAAPPKELRRVATGPGVSNAEWPTVVPAADQTSQSDAGPDTPSDNC